MKLVVLAVILGVAGLIAVQIYLTVTGQDCPNGRVVATEAECRATAGFPAAFCAEAFRRAPEVARVSGGFFTNADDCVRQTNATCFEVDQPMGWRARPAAWCVAPTPEGGVSRLAPVYAGHNVRGTRP